jgi:hypothetical protein
MSMNARFLRNPSFRDWSFRHVLAGMTLCLAAGTAGAATTEDLSRINEQLGRVAAPWCGKLADFDAQGVRRCTISVVSLGEGDVPFAGSIAGGIWITEAMLRPLTRDELAIVLGHEMAHLVLGHSLVTLRHEREGQVGRHTDGFTGFMEQTSVTPHDDTPTDRKAQELDADALGLVFAGLAGYDVRQGAALWGAGGRRISGFENPATATHPASSTRLARARTTAKNFCDAVRDGRMPLPALDRLQPPYPLNRDELARQLDPDALTQACAQTETSSRPSPSPSKVTARPLAPTTP